MAVTAEQRERWARIILRYGAGDLIGEIAHDEGVDRKTVYNVARRAGLPRRHRFDGARTARIVSGYRADVPVGEIAGREGVCRTYVRAVARRAGLPPRSEWQRKYPIDHAAFERPSQVGWWLIGLLAADGSVARKGNQISLTQRAADADVLHKFLSHVGCPEKPLIELKMSPNPEALPRSRAFAAVVNSASMKSALAEHGIVPGKTRDLRLGERAAAEPAVWLGLLDGDGWVSRKGQRGRPLLDFCGTRAVMEQCSAFCGERLSFQRLEAPTVGAHRAGLCRVKLHGANAARAARILLASSPISLDRKRRTLEAIVSGESERSPGSAASDANM
ncbi:MAG: hypothetical protein FJW90_11785 [Actinobacteria bacterium]|nr:hypothetical protein [Actinomycetota bacterium]